MCIFKSQLIDKGTNKVTKENVQENKHVQFDTTSSRYDLAIKEVEERVKLGWSVKASFMLGGGYLRVDYVRADPNRYKSVKASPMLGGGYLRVDYVRADPNRYKDVGKTNDSKVDAEPALSGVGSIEVAAEEVVEQKPKPTRKTTATKKVEDKPDE